MRLSSLGLVLAALAAGCASVPNQTSNQTPLMKNLGSKATYAELSAGGNALVVRVPGTIEGAADEIAERATDPVIKRRALEWKIETVAAFYLTLLQPGPLEAMFDTWALGLQLEVYLETGPARDRFGDLQPLAVAAVKNAVAEIRAEAKELAKNPDGFEKASQMVQTWAAEHPITGPLSSRQSLLRTLATKAGQSEESVWDAFGNVNATLWDLSSRLNLYAAYLPRAARWQAQLLLEQVVAKKDNQDVLATMRSFHQLTERTNALISPEALAAALRQAEATVQRETAITLASIDQQRVATLAYFTQERVAAMEAINTQRLGAVADVDHQRVLVMKDLDDLKRTALADVEGLLWRTVLRTAVVTAVLLVFTAVLALVVISRARRRPAGVG